MQTFVLGCRTSKEVLGCVPSCKSCKMCAGLEKVLLMGWPGKTLPKQHRDHNNKHKGKALIHHNPYVRDGQVRIASPTTISCAREAAKLCAGDIRGSLVTTVDTKTTAWP